MTTQFLTREGFRKLQEELDYLRSVKRQEIADRLHDAMEGGELIENAEYEAAKNEQAFVEGRIKELEMILATAHLIEDEPHESDVIVVGSHVTLRPDDSNEKEAYTIVGPAEADPTNGLISNESPLGKALLGHKKGDRVQVDAPAGSFVVHILKVE